MLLALPHCKAQAPRERGMARLLDCSPQGGKADQAKALELPLISWAYLVRSALDISQRFPEVWVSGLGYLWRP